MLNRLPLRKSLPLLLGLFAVVFTLLQTSIYLPRSVDNALHSWRTHSSQIFVLLQSSLGDHLRQGRQEERATELSDLASLRGVRWAMVVDQNQHVIATSRLGLHTEQISQLDSAELHKRIASGQPSWLELGPQRYLAIYPLERGHQDTSVDLQALLVEMDFTPLLWQTKRTAWLHLAQTLGLLLLLGLLLNHLYGRLLTKRLARIEQAATQFAEDQQPRTIEVTGHDEIGQLATSFEQMMTQLNQRQRDVRESEALFRSLIDSAPLGMLVVDRELRVEQANPAAAALFGCSTTQLLGNLPADRLVESSAVERLQQTPPNVAIELTGRRGAQHVPLEITCTPFVRHGKRYSLILLRDISDRLKAEQRLRFLAHFDPLTRLANRHSMVQRLEQLLLANCRLGLLFIDLDHFKRINDTLGHEIGDNLLVEIAGRLQVHLPKQSLLARSGGDEFIVLLEGASLRETHALAEQLVGHFVLPFQVRQYECFISPSIGLTHCNSHGSSASELLKQADLALYAAKDRGRNCIASFSAELSSAAELRRQLETELRRAIDQQEFALHYQLQVDNQGQPQAMEALLRWYSPTRGLVSPAEFIPILEESGMIIETTRWVFRTACRQACQWRDEGRGLRIAINLSPLDFRQADLAGNLLRILAEEGAEAELLELEITESALLDSGDEVQQCLARLKAAGFLLLLDDFGTGYASLTYLQRFPFDGIKIDRQFVAGLPDSPHSVALVRGILTMAKHLGLHVVAEGVENQRQAAFLRLNACPSLQGFLYARPLPAEQCHAKRLDGKLVRLNPQDY
ncbi:bifunctional diguanylate cyclase/phosphodiesterase [Pseudomonas sp.]|uniref:putative bifunctional diguanylate cyclase/phosphodiesterase n=1 Tax=Pseudomonas sp. TaxID=306 RepID=UPI00272EF9E8|nr:EAL domain-containing protein [Pseudomonas sp.]MDP2242676.1 EAL domain-containing protein [Pseudomonas sp.]